jgi:TPR repeat protein
MDELDGGTMGTTCGDNFDREASVVSGTRRILNRSRRVFFVATAAAVLLLSTSSFVEAASFGQGVSAFNRRDYVSASHIFIPLAEQGNPAAQSYLGFMFETGRGVPQNYTESAMWYRRAAEQGDSLAQYSLGLLYDKGQGVPLDIVEANKWLNLSTAAAPRQAREARVRIRDALTGKMTRGEIARARLRALEWAPVRER